MSRFISWLHLSDLHACQPKSGWDAKRVLDSLRTDLLKMNREQSLRPDLIFFTGDAAFGHISDHGGETISEQFRMANKFLDEVRHSFCPEIPKQNMFLVPGNHDVNCFRIHIFESDWLANQQSLEEVENLIRDAGEDWQVLLNRLSDYEHFLDTYGYSHLLTGRERLIYADVRTVAGMQIGIAGFNSAWSSRGAGRKESRGESQNTQIAHRLGTN